MDAPGRTVVTPGGEIPIHRLEWQEVVRKVPRASRPVYLQKLYSRSRADRAPADLNRHSRPIKALAMRTTPVRAGPLDI